MKKIKIFVSYSWGEEENKDWVNRLITELNENNFDIILDQDKFRNQTNNLDRFMIDNLLDADFIIVVSTPSYVEKANRKDDGSRGSKKTGVEIETEYIAQRKHQNYQAIIPILLEKGEENDLPKYLENLSYIDMTTEEKYIKGIIEIKSRINGGNKISIPSTKEFSNNIYSNHEDFNISFSYKSDPVQVSAIIHFKDVEIFLDHKQVNKLFLRYFKGRFEQNPESRSIVLTTDTFRVKLSSKLYSRLLHDLERHAEYYLDEVRKYETKYESYGFETVKKKYAYKIATVEKNIWDLMIRTANLFDWDNGETEWHIFQRNNFYVHVFSPVISYNKKYNAGEHTILFAEKTDDIVSNKLNIYVEPKAITIFKKEMKVNKRDVWGVRTTQKWLIKEFIPFVLRENNYKNEDGIFYWLAEDEDIISKLQYFYLCNQANVSLEELKKLRDALHYCIANSTIINQKGYIKTKLGVSMSDEVNQGDNLLIEYLYSKTFEEYIGNGYQNSSKADDILRCIKVFTDSYSKDKMDDDDIEHIKVLLEGMIIKMQKIELLEKYSLINFE